MSTTLDQLLEKTSRTFALCIPLLPEPTRREVTIAYLLFRIADTFEDAAAWPLDRQVQALVEFERLLEEPERSKAESLVESWLEEVPTEHEGYLELLREVPYVLEEYMALRPAGREIVGRHTARTATGMADLVQRFDDDGTLRLGSFQDLRDYCYVVAGIVGEMLTELFLLDRPELEGVAAALTERAALFGEGLQLTNIVKDALVDRDEGRRFLPADLDLSLVFAQARTDLEAAAEYTRALQDSGAEQGIVAFNALPALLARATLDTVESQGAGSKLSRPEVFAIVQRMEQALQRGEPVITPTARAER